jgi:hypothetical protein
MDPLSTLCRTFLLFQKLKCSVVLDLAVALHRVLLTCGGGGGGCDTAAVNTEHVTLKGALLCSNAEFGRNNFILILMYL